MGLLIGIWITAAVLVLLTGTVRSFENPPRGRGLNAFC